MKCSEVKKILEEYAEGKALKDKNALRHMRECPACAREYDVIKKMKAVFRKKEKVNIPSDFNDTVWARLKEQPPMTWRRALKPVFQRPFVPQLAAAAIAVVLILVFGIRFGTNTQGQKLAQANKPEQAAAQKKIPVLQAAVQPQEKEAAVKGQQIIVAGKQAETKKQETAENKTTQLKQDAVAQYDAGQPAPRMAMAAAGKQVLVSAAQQTTLTSDENGKTTSPADIQKIPTPEETNTNLQIKNNVINPEKGESVTIQYTVTQPSEILIKVYDRRGETIKTIESGFKQSGIYVDSWNGEDDTGAQVGAGIYIVYIKTGLVQAKRKVCIVR
jgi:hypothetical protein